MKLKAVRDRRGEGFHCRVATSPMQFFFDDITLIGSSLKRFSEDSTKWKESSRRLAFKRLFPNHQKTQYVSTLPQRAAKVSPGEDKGKEGMKVLGRVIALRDTTDEDVESKLQSGWRRFRELRKIPIAPTEIRHRLRIYRSCIVQKVAWSSETWVLTKKRLQRLRGFELSIMRRMISNPGANLEDPAQRHSAHWEHIANTQTPANRQVLFEEIFRVGRACKPDAGNTVGQENPGRAKCRMVEDTARKLRSRRPATRVSRALRARETPVAGWRDRNTQRK